MSTVSTAALKQQLSHYLHQVQAGEDVIVTSHRRPVARLTTAGDNSHALTLIQPRRPKTDLALIARVPLRKKMDPVAVLQADRATR